MRDIANLRRWLDLSGVHDLYRDHQLSERGNLCWWCDLPRLGDLYRHHNL